MSNIANISRRYFRCTRAVSDEPPGICLGILEPTADGVSLACDRCGTTYPLEQWGANLAPSNAPTDVIGYNEEERRSQYLRLHYDAWLPKDPHGPIAQAFGIAPFEQDFYERISLELADLNLLGREFFLDIGCAAGRLTMASAEHLSPEGVALGIDTNITLLRLAQSLSQSPSTGSGDEASLAVALRKKFGRALDRVLYASMDANRLALESGSVDMVLALNIVDRLEAPRVVLNEIGRVLRVGGYLVLSCPFDWPKEVPTDQRAYTLDQLVDKSVFFRTRTDPAVPWVVRDAGNDRELHLYACELGIYRRI